MAKYQDILINHDPLAGQTEDIRTDKHGQAALICDRDVIAQDIVHAILESGLLVEMIAERSGDRRRLLLNRLILLVEDDERIIPGTVSLAEDVANFSAGNGVWTVVADTYEFGQFKRGFAL